MTRLCFVSTFSLLLPMSSLLAALETRPMESRTESTCAKVTQKAVQTSNFNFDRLSKKLRETLELASKEESRQVFEVYIRLEKLIDVGEKESGLHSLRAQLRLPRLKVVSLNIYDVSPFGNARETATDTRMGFIGEVKVQGQAQELLNILDSKQYKFTSADLVSQPLPWILKIRASQRAVVQAEVLSLGGNVLEAMSSPQILYVLMPTNHSITDLSHDSIEERVLDRPLMDHIPLRKSS